MHYLVYLVQLVVVIYIAQLKNVILENPLDKLNEEVKEDGDEKEQCRGLVLETLEEMEQGKEAEQRKAPRTKRDEDQEEGKADHRVEDVLFFVFSLLHGSSLYWTRTRSRGR